MSERWRRVAGENTPLPSKERGPDASLSMILANEKYQQYAFDYSVRYSSLTLREVPTEIQESEAFRRTVAAVEWPDDMDTMKVVPPYDYKDPQEFIESIFGGENGLRDNVQEKKFLNNFNTLLRYKSASIDERGVAHPNKGSIESMTASMTPALIRAEQIAPDLLRALRSELATAGTSLERRHLYEENPDVVAGAYMAYRIMGRLVKRDDPTISARLMGDTSGRLIDPETSAHDTLVR